MTTRPIYRATTRRVQLAGAIVAAGATLALATALRPGELPERTLRWAGVHEGSVAQPRVAPETPPTQAVAAAPAPTAQTAQR
jgi:hypothetical protein